MKKLLNIREVKQLPKNSDFNVMGVVSKFTRRKDRNDNPFWDVTLNDQNGELDGKIWYGATWKTRQGGDTFPIDPDNCGLKFEGSSVGVVGKVAEYRDQVQYNFTEIYYLDQSQWPPHKFTRHTPVDMQFLEDSFEKLIAEIHYEPLTNFVNAAFFKYNLWENFRIWPAAISLHHAYVGGLLEHSVSVATGARDIAEHYHDFAVNVNMDLVIAGALLHDIGKLEAYSPLPATRMTTAGNIIEHITLGYNMFMKFAGLENLDEDITLALGHIILSHHGIREFGSPILPQTPEAMIVNAADDLDFKLSYWKYQVDALGEGSEFTDYLPLIDRRLWRGIERK